MNIEIITLLEASLRRYSSSWSSWWRQMLHIMITITITMVKGMVIIIMVFTLLEAFLRRCSGASLPFPAATLRTTSFAWLTR